MLFKNNAKIGARTSTRPSACWSRARRRTSSSWTTSRSPPFSDANIDGHMIFGMTGRQCQTTIANGKLLMKDRELIGVDEEAVNAHILEESRSSGAR